MSKAPDFYFQAIQQIMMDKWSNNRVICLGDTAFAPTPLMGMGTSLAELGGCLLAGELAKLGEGEHPKKALGAYEKAFRPFVEQTQERGRGDLLQTAISTMSKAATLPWFVRLIGGDKTTEQNDDGFQLPQYESLDKML
ncbi:hypothetical protein EJ07DRAFT_154087 [Lizonia empirigonia]|nr:hypothetical protein EJ07DRAFT_154087 [Lizonia empirigonia]